MFTHTVIISYPALVLLDCFLKSESGPQVHIERLSKQLGIDAPLLAFAWNHKMPESALELDVDSVAFRSYETPLQKKRSGNKSVGKTASSSRKKSNEKRVRSEGKRPSGPPEFYSGPPQKPLILYGERKPWPPGWIEKQFVRQGGDSAGHVDFYWFTPQLGNRLRSMVRVKEFMEALERNNGDEKKTWSAHFGR